MSLRSSNKMVKKSSNRFTNILMWKCPKCYSGYMFEEPNPYKLKKLYKLNDTCESCNHSFSPEPMYYDGAMYISYSFSVAIVITIFVAFKILFEEPNYDLMIGITIGLAVLLSPITFRLSRSLWIHIFVKYDDSTVLKKEG